MTVKKFIGTGVKIIIATVVIAFLGLKSLDFFNFTTPLDQWYYAYLGFGLTGGGVIAYLIVFMFDADTELKKTIAIVMLAVCTIGEVVTAGFGLQVNAWQQSGFQMQEADFKAMVLAVQLLAFAHAIALIFYIAGDKIIEAFGDEDKDGIPNYRDADYKGKGNFKLFPSTTVDNTPALQARIKELEARLEAKNPTDGTGTQK